MKFEFILIIQLVFTHNNYLISVSVYNGKQSEEFGVTYQHSNQGNLKFQNQFMKRYLEPIARKRDFKNLILIYGDL